MRGLGALPLALSVLLAVSPATSNAASFVDGYEQMATVFYSWPAAGRVVALTFDDGDAHGDNLEAILDILEAEGVTASFFPTGYAVAQSPDTWRRVATEGYPIGNHSLTHPDMTTLDYDDVLYELTEWRRVVEEVIGEPTMPYARPPFGYFNRTMLRAATDAGYEAVVNWDVDTFDWRDGTDLVVQRGISGEDGSIVLMHDEASSVEALPQIIASYKERGFTFVTIPELLAGARVITGTAKYRVVHLRKVEGSTAKLDIYVKSDETGNVVRAGLEYSRRTGYFSPPEPGVIRFVRARARPNVCSEWTCGLIASAPVVDGVAQGTIVLHRTGYLQMVEAGAAASLDASTVRLSAPSTTKLNLYVVPVALARNPDGLRIHRRGKAGCLESANAPGTLIRGAQANNFRLPPGTSYVTLHAASDTSCRRAPVGGPYTVTGAAGARSYLMLYGQPGAMRARLAAIPAP